MLLSALIYCYLLGFKGVLVAADVKKSERRTPNDTSCLEL